MHIYIKTHFNKEVRVSRHRGHVVLLQALSPQLDSLHGPKVGAAPVKPLVIAMTPLSVMNQDLLVLVIDLLNAGGIPDHFKHRTVSLH